MHNHLEMKHMLQIASNSRNTSTSEQHSVQRQMSVSDTQPWK